LVVKDRLFGGKDGLVVKGDAQLGEKRRGGRDTSRRIQRDLTVLRKTREFKTESRELISETREFSSESCGFAEHGEKQARNREESQIFVRDVRELREFKETKGSQRIVRASQRNTSVLRGLRET
jgi:hypothetical protein